MRSCARIHAAAVVAHFDDDLRALMKGIEINGAARGLAGSEALIGRLDAVIDGVAHEVHERFGERIQNALVEIGVLSGDLQSHVFAALFGHVANDARKAAEELLDGHHANFQNALVKFIEHAGLKCHGISELGAQWDRAHAAGRIR